MVVGSKSRSPVNNSDVIQLIGVVGHGEFGILFTMQFSYDSCVFDSDYFGELWETIITIIITIILVSERCYHYRTK